MTKHPRGLAGARICYRDLLRRILIETNFMHSRDPLRRTFKRRIREAIEIHWQTPTMNRNNGYEVPTIYGDVLSRGFHHPKSRDKTSNTIFKHIWRGVGGLIWKMACSWHLLLNRLTFDFTPKFCYLMHFKVYTMLLLLLLLSMMLLVSWCSCCFRRGSCIPRLRCQGPREDDVCQ